MREVRVHALASVKGGVGKSTLAVAACLALEQLDRYPVLVDIDLTGTSVADALQMQAPAIDVDEEGRMSPKSASGGFLDVQETDRRRRKRWDSEHAGRWVRYMNDALLAEPDQRIDSRDFLWSLPGDHAMRIVPSSSANVDVRIALTWLHREDTLWWKTFLRRFLDFVVVQNADVTDIVLDLPPGLFGFSRAGLSLLLDAHDRRWTVDGVMLVPRPMLVLSPDLTDLYPGIRNYLALRTQLPPLRVVVNRWPGSRGELGDDLARVYPELPIPANASFIGEYTTSLGRLFRVGDRGLPKFAETDILLRALHLEGSPG